MLVQTSALLPSSGGCVCGGLLSSSRSRRLSGSSGNERRIEAIRSTGATIDIGRLAETYMDSAYGGYGLFYALFWRTWPAPRLGVGKFVDRVTDTGREVAAGASDRPSRRSVLPRLLPEGRAPRAVLEEPGDAACCARSHGGADHTPLVRSFFGEPLDDPVRGSPSRTSRRKLVSLLAVPSSAT